MHVGPPSCNKVLAAIIATKTKEKRGVLYGQIESSNIAAFKYDFKTSSLYITFKSGDTYQYLNVPSKVVLNFLEAESHGKDFHRSIRSQYEYTKLRT